MNMNEVIKIIKETDAIFFDEKRRSDVSKKGEFDFVTRADKDISEYLHKKLWEEFPDVSFMSEEEGKDNNKSDRMWILDPIDGTTNFMKGLPLCAVSLGYVENGEISAGVIYVPDTCELFWAEKGKGAYLNGKRINCSDKKSLRDCLALFEFNAYFKNDSDNAVKQAEKLYTLCQDIRVLGCAALEMAYVASGRADVFLGRYLKPWDYAAGTIIIREAGGIVGRCDGEFDINNLNSHIIASNKYVFNDFAEMLK